MNTVFATKNAKTGKKGCTHDKDKRNDGCWKGMAKRKNVIEFTGSTLQIAAQKADAAGYRPCKKCLLGILSDVIVGHDDYAGRMDEEGELK